MKTKGAGGRMVSVGFGNFVFVTRVVAVVCPDTSPVKRVVLQARESGKLVDATCGRRTRSVVVCDSGQVVLSGLSPETLATRMSGEEET